MGFLPTPSSPPPPGNLQHGTRRRRHALRPSTIFVVTILVIFYLQFSYLPRRYFDADIPASVVELLQSHLDVLDAGLEKCQEAHTPPVEYRFPVSSVRTNPRWNPVNGQNTTVILRNATLFDGETFVDGPMDIIFERGSIVSVELTTEEPSLVVSHGKALVVDLKGQYVSPGLVDMHSHHLVGTWPSLSVTSEENEINDETGPLTPMVRALDSMHLDDVATRLIASAGVTSSLILPGSANIIGGEAYPVKNILKPGKNGEEVVGEMLLEYGLQDIDRRRYIKMACGENPSGLYKHTRMGNAWKFREQLAKGQDLLKKQDAWCLSAAAARDSNDMDAISALVQLSADAKVGFPEDLKLESTVAVLRGQINVNIHCYEPEDFEGMLRHSEEFGFPINAFHHALDAWKVPEMIKSSGHNITIATFQDFSLYKKESYQANLYAGKILAEHGVPVAYKSDHSVAETSAQYLLFQASGAHAFGLAEHLALQAVTSVPATSLQQGHRIGYVRPGYDADIVVWDSHPLSVGATPKQVYIDGNPTLDTAKVDESLRTKASRPPSASVPRVRPELAEEERHSTCENVEMTSQRIIVTGISKSFVQKIEAPSATGPALDNKLTLILDAGRVACFSSDCAFDSARDTIIKLEDGHVLPGLTAFSSSLGLAEIETEDSTTDGAIDNSLDPLNPDNVVYAKYGIHLEGRAFRRAQIGGVTRAVTAPLNGDGGFLRGVSVGIKTSGNRTILDGGIFQEDVALHFNLGQDARSTRSTPTISSAVAKLRKILSENKGKDTIYGKAADGKIPVVVHVTNRYDISQLIKVKKDLGSVNIVLLGGHDAPAVAEELASAEIPLIYLGFLSGPDTWEKKAMLPGPPLSRSPVDIFSEANLTFSLASNSEGAPIADSKIHNLGLLASWAAKYAGLTEMQAVNLVSRNVEKTLGLDENTDFVIYEGNPLEFGASVVLTVDGDDNRIVNCWPQAM